MLVIAVVRALWPVTTLILHSGSQPEAYSNVTVHWHIGYISVPIVSPGTGPVAI